MVLNFRYSEWMSPGTKSCPRYLGMYWVYRSHGLFLGLGWSRCDRASESLGRVFSGELGTGAVGGGGRYPSLAAELPNSYESNGWLHRAEIVGVLAQGHVWHTYELPITWVFNLQSALLGLLALKNDFSFLIKKNPWSFWHITLI